MENITEIKMDEEGKISTHKIIIKEVKLKKYLVRAYLVALAISMYLIIADLLK